MHLAGQTEIRAPRQRVWDALVDPRQIAACVPGHPEVEVVNDRHMRAKVPVGSGFLRTTAVIDIELVELRPPEHATATASGGAMGGSANATATLDVDDLGPSLSRVRWTTELTLGGMLSGFGSMVEAPARKGVDQTLDCLKSKLEAEAASAAPVSPAPGGSGAPGSSGGSGGAGSAGGQGASGSPGAPA